MDKDDKELLKSAAESIESVRAIASAANALEEELRSLEEDMSSSTSTSLSSPTIGRGRGRGRSRTLPAWMNQAKQSSDTPAKGLSSPELSTRKKRMWDSGTTSATNTTALAAPSSLGRGRGMNRTRPAWMSTKAWSTRQDHLPSSNDSGAASSLANGGVDENVSPNPNNTGKWEEHTKGIGSKLLKKWGHKEGEGLGAKGDGLAEPIKAVVLPFRVGLGHVSKKQLKKIKSTTSTSISDSANNPTTQRNIVMLIQEKKNISLGQFKQLYQSRFEKELCHKGKLNVALKKVPGVIVSSNNRVTFANVGKENVKPAAKSAPEEQMVSVSNKVQAVSSKKIPTPASKKQQPKKKTQVVKHVVQKKKTKKKKPETNSEDDVYLVNLVHRLTSDNARLQARITDLEAELAKTKAGNKQS